MWQLDALFWGPVASHTGRRELRFEEELGYKPPRLASIDPLPSAMPPIPKVPFLNLRTVSPADNQVENISHQTRQAKPGLLANKFYFWALELQPPRVTVFNVPFINTTFPPDMSTRVSWNLGFITAMYSPLWGTRSQAACIRGGHLLIFKIKWMKHLTKQGRIYFWLNLRGIGSYGGLNENNPIGSDVWILDPQLVVLFG